MNAVVYHWEIIMLSSVKKGVSVVLFCPLVAYAYIPPVKPVFHLSVSDAPAAASTNNGSTSTSQNNDLDIFGPMVSNPLPASSSAAQFSQVKSSKNSPSQI